MGFFKKRTFNEKIKLRVLNTYDLLFLWGKILFYNYAVLISCKSNIHFLSSDAISIQAIITWLLSDWNSYNGLPVPFFPPSFPPALVQFPFYKLWRSWNLSISPHSLRIKPKAFKTLRDMPTANLDSTFYLHNSTSGTWCSSHNIQLCTVFLYTVLSPQDLWPCCSPCWKALLLPLCWSFIFSSGSTLLVLKVLVRHYLLHKPSLIAPPPLSRLDWCCATLCFYLANDSK